LTASSRAIYHINFLSLLDRHGTWILSFHGHPLLIHRLLLTSELFSQVTQPNMVSLSIGSVGGALAQETIIDTEAHKGLPPFSFN